MEGYCINRYHSFKSCLNDFSKAKDRQDYKEDSFVLSGIIARFCLTFDLSWKLMKDIIVDYYAIRDFTLGSPRESLKMAFKVKLIEDDAIWFEVLKLRNQLAHDYNSELAYKVCDKVISVYIDFFLKFEERVDQLMIEIKKEFNVL